MTAGLAVATFVKALGVGFLARPRSAAAAAATESPPTMLAGDGGWPRWPASVWRSLPPLLGPACPGRSASPTGTGDRCVGGAVTLRLSGIAEHAVAAADRGRAAGGRRGDRGRWPGWCGCGSPGAGRSPCGTAAPGRPPPGCSTPPPSFAEPLQRVFDDVLAPQTDVDVTPYAESAVPGRAGRLTSAGCRTGSSTGSTSRSSPRCRRLGRLGPVLANGSVHRYLAYGFWA